jgi:hypothetical protein
MIVRNNGYGLMVVPRVDKKSKKAKGTVRLHPGVNQIDEDVLEEIKDNLDREKKSKVSKGKHAGRMKIEIVTAQAVDEKGEAKGAPKVVKTLSETSPEDAQALINECADMPTLKKWKQYEKREDVRLMIMNRIDDIEKEGADGSDED